MPLEVPETCIAVLLFLFGLALGSFFNVCICRIPREESVVSPPSHCPSCGQTISWWQNIPVFSYLLLRGRCFSCKQAISPRYVLVELLTGCLFLAVFLHGGWRLATISQLFFIALLIPITFIDLDYQIIPDRFSLGGIVLGFLSSFCCSGVSWQQSGLGIVVGGGTLWIIAEGYYRFTGREGMGGGDVKLLAMIGAFLGVKSLLLVILVSSLAGSLIGIMLMVRSHRNSQYAVPFGPFLAFGAAVYLFWGEPLISWYFGWMAGS
ncbi:MAG: prepilin peptidase [Deltaproteobacteria bacterium]|nr:prepilin peptidase [Candidatus Anaeroferrophillus wilburensis]MBN2888089.1 prepilin peptidase [Deltaproteobacteria bacterium]